MQNEEKIHFIPNMLAYVGIFLYLCRLNSEYVKICVGIG
jgi:hypothetical protein